MSPLDGGFSAFSNGSSGTYTLYQDVVIPAESHFTLQWNDRIRNHHTVFADPNQEYRVEIRNTSNVVLSTVFSTNLGEQLLRDWTQHSSDLSAYAGQTIRIAYVVQSNLFFLNVHIDNVQIVSGGGNALGEIPVLLLEGQHSSDINFGNQFLPNGEIHGAKWNDLDGDSVWDQPDEPGLAGWTIYLDANNNGALDNGEKWTTTGADGSYAFTNLPAGVYVVGELLKSGWMQTSPGPFSTASLVVNGNFETGSLSGWTQENIGGAGSFVINNGTVNPTGPDGPLPPYQGTYSALSNATTVHIRSIRTS